MHCNILCCVELCFAGCAVSYCIILHCMAYSARESKSPAVSKNRKIRTKVVSKVLYGRWRLRVMGSLYYTAVSTKVNVPQKCKIVHDNAHWHYGYKSLFLIDWGSLKQLKKIIITHNNLRHCRISFSPFHNLSRNSCIPTGRCTVHTL